MERTDLVMWKDRGIFGVCGDMRCDVLEDCLDEWDIENQRIGSSLSDVGVEVVKTWGNPSGERTGLPWKMPEIR